jgi:hypothetical protein
MYGGSSFWKISIYDKNNENVLYLTEYGVTRIEHKMVIRISLQSLKQKKNKI